VKLTASNLATFLVVIVLAWLGLKLLGVALKALGLLILVGVAIALYVGAQRMIGKSR
jgi:hypothetical protein